MIRQAYASSSELLIKKNNDYGEAWRYMEPESFTDEIILRTSRMKKIIRRDGNFSFLTISSQLHDTLNYSFFGMISRGLDDQP
nr:nucleotide modification associated domain-containing protein [Halomonas salicampi]